MKKDKEEIKKEEGEASPALPRLRSGRNVRASAPTPPSACLSAPPSAGDTPATPPDKPPESETQNGADDAKTITVTLRHKTEYPHYRRAGLVLKQTPQAFSVTEGQLALLMPDKRVEIIEGGKTK
jgi:hypothetical protein